MTSQLKRLSLIGMLTALLSACLGDSTQLPANFPDDIPIISGEIYSARSTRFEDGRGFVVDVLTEASYEEVSEFYKDVVGPYGNGYIRVETTRSDAPTRYVTIAVHLGR